MSICVNIQPKNVNLGVFRWLKKIVNVNFEQPLSTYLGMTTNNVYTNIYFAVNFCLHISLNMPLAIGWLELAFIPIKGNYVLSLKRLPHLRLA